MRVRLPKQAGTRGCYSYSHVSTPPYMHAVHRRRRRSNSSSSFLFYFDGVDHWWGGGMQQPSNTTTRASRCPWDVEGCQQPPHQ